MAGVIPNDAELAALEDIINNHTFTLKLYSNDITPDETTTVGTLTEVSGGGYASYEIPDLDWSLTAGSPSIAVAPAHDFNFTGATSAPGTIYGYYVVDETNRLRWVERFEASVAPFTPANNTQVRITPKLRTS